MAAPRAEIIDMALDEGVEGRSLAKRESPGALAKSALEVAIGVTEQIRAAWR